MRRDVVESWSNSSVAKRFASFFDVGLGWWFKSSRHCARERAT